ncbi:hypothetical protein ABPG75_012336 [Micractinium tetrahymenae]
MAGRELQRRQQRAAQQAAEAGEGQAEAAAEEDREQEQLSSVFDGPSVVYRGFKWSPSLEQSMVLPSGHSWTFGQQQPPQPQPPQQPQPQPQVQRLAPHVQQQLAQRMQPLQRAGVPGQLMQQAQQAHADAQRAQQLLQHWQQIVPGQPVVVILLRPQQQAAAAAPAAAPPAAAVADVQQDGRAAGAPAPAPYRHDLGHPARSARPILKAWLCLEATALLPLASACSSSGGGGGGGDGGDSSSSSSSGGTAGEACRAALHASLGPLISAQCSSLRRGATGILAWDQQDACPGALLSGAFCSARGLPDGSGPMLCFPLVAFRMRPPGEPAHILPGLTIHPEDHTARFCLSVEVQPNLGRPLSG